MFKMLLKNVLDILQIFKVPEKMQKAKKLRVIFSNSTDFFGRITIYKLDIIGRIIE